MPYLGEILSLIVGGCLGSWITHRLSRDGSRADRLREARTIVRDLIDRIRAEHPSFLHKLHDESRDTVAELRNRILDDISFWRRQRFRDACNEYIVLGIDQTMPIVIPRSAHRPTTDEEKRADKEAWLKPGQVLDTHATAILTAIK